MKRVVNLYPDRTDRYRLVVDDDLKTAYAERRYRHRGWDTAPLSINTGRSQPIYVLTLTDKASGLSSKTKLLHRLIAEHFVDNPDPINNTIVTFKDGDSLNCYPDNLKWVSRYDQIARLSQAERIEKYAGYKDIIPCVGCGEDTSSGFCDTYPHCRGDKVNTKNFKGFPLDHLSFKERTYIDARRRGWSIQDIAEIYDTSASAVTRVINSGIKKAHSKKE